LADSLKGKVIIVTGAGRGIGRAVALFLAKEGAAVVVNDPGVALDGSGGTIAVADEVAKEVQRAGGQAAAHFGSVVQMKTGEELVQAALERFGRLDGAVTCHGILRDRMVFNMTEEEWDSVLAVHLKGTFSVCKAAAELFRRQRSGSLVTFTSESGLVGNPGQANYGAAKSAIAGFTLAMAKELAPYGVRANAVAPRARTRMTQGMTPDFLARQAQRGIQGIEELFAGVQEWLPEDVAPFVAFLLSDLASQITGQLFLVYGSTVGLLSRPRPVKTLLTPPGGWSNEELRRLLPETLAKDLVNPAPPQRDPS
jgi:NAD(P)-dependent dehydrogenase (short-subunit alcohol dehydrogenase family)